MREIDSQWEVAVQHREPNPAPCDNQEVRNRIGGGSKLEEGGDLCILKADSRCCMAETNITL